MENNFSQLQKWLLSSLIETSPQTAYNLRINFEERYQRFTEIENAVKADNKRKTLSEKLEKEKNPEKRKELQEHISLIKSHESYLQPNQIYKECDNLVRMELISLRNNNGKKEYSFTGDKCFTGTLLFRAIGKTAIMVQCPNADKCFFGKQGIKPIEQKCMYHDIYKRLKPLYEVKF